MDASSASIVRALSSNVPELPETPHQVSKKVLGEEEHSLVHFTK